MDLILASTSDTRRSILTAARIPHRVVDPGDVELSIRATHPGETATRRALAKARVVLQQHPKAVVLGADQVAYAPDAPDHWWGKPANADAQLAHLLSQRGRQHALVTGIALVRSGREIVDSATTTLEMRGDLSDAEIAAYVDTGEGSGCAGGYAIEGRGGLLFERVSGDWYNVLGLPLFLVMTHLRAWGWRAVREGA